MKPLIVVALLGGAFGCQRAVVPGDDSGGGTGADTETEPGRRWMQVAMSTTGLTCALDDLGRVFCAGDDSDGAVSAAPTAGGYREVAAGSAACAINSTGRAECWGVRPGLPGVADVPDTEVHGLSFVQQFPCALRDSDDHPVCWAWDGRDPPYGGALPPDRPSVQVRVDTSRACVRTAAGEVDCDGIEWDGTADNPPAWSVSPPEGSTFLDVAVGHRVACGVQTDASLLCWGEDGEWGQGVVTGAPAGEFTALCAASGSACAVSRDGEVLCWGTMATWGPAITMSPPGLRVVSFSCGSGAACGLTALGELHCGGDGPQHGSLDLPRLPPP